MRTENRARIIFIEREVSFGGGRVVRMDKVDAELTCDEAHVVVPGETVCQCGAIEVVTSGASVVLLKRMPLDTNDWRMVVGTVKPSED